MKSLSFFEVSRGIFHLLLVGDIAIGTFNYNKLIGDQKIVYYLLICTSIVEVVTVLLWRLKRNNNFVYHFYSVTEFLLLGTLYVRHLKLWIKPVYLQSVIILFIMFAVTNTLFFQNLKEFNSHTTVVESVLLILFGMLYCYYWLKHGGHQPLKRVPMFWINTSVLAYFSGAMILFHVVNDLVPQPLKERQLIWGVHSLFNIAHYFLYGVALWVTPLKPTDSRLNL